MSSFPYRTPAQRPPNAIVAPVDEATRLGGLRSTHSGGSLQRLLMVPALLSLVLFGVAISSPFIDNYPDSSTIVVSLLVALAVAATVFGLLARSLLRRRDLRIDLHADGLIVHRRGSRDVVIFEDVSEVWYELTHHLYGQVTVPSMRLVEFSGVTHRVPLTVEDLVAVAGAIQRRCSDHLLSEARQALSEGESLTFGSTLLDRNGITIGGVPASWSELRLVRLQPGRAIFFRRWPLLPWRTVSHDAVPHPGVFLRLVMELAPRVEDDDSLAKLLR